ncbi:hypothetical protein, partial [Klebsiella pneumoniae]
AARIIEGTIPERDITPAAAKIFNALRRNVQQLEKLINKVLEENSNVETDMGLKVEKREFDLWPLVESLIRDLLPIAATSSTHLINQVPDDLVA